MVTVQKAPTRPVLETVHDVDVDDGRGAAYGAALALFAFSAMTGFFLFVWFTHTTAQLSWRSAIALVSTMLGATTAALVLRAPSRAHVAAGILVMLGSLVRIGPPDDWTSVSFTLVAMTALLLIPLVHAVVALRK